MQIVVGNLRARPWAVGVWAVDPRVLGSLLSFPVGLGAGLVMCLVIAISTGPRSQIPLPSGPGACGPAGVAPKEKRKSRGAAATWDMVTFFSPGVAVSVICKRKKEKKWRGLQSLSRLLLFTPDSSPFKFCLGPVAGNRGTGPSAQSWLLKIRVEQGRIPPAVQNLKCSRNKQGRPGRRGRGLHHGTAAFT